MNKKIIGNIFVAGIFLCQASLVFARYNPHNFQIPVYYSQGSIISRSPASSPSPYIYVQRNSTFSSWNNPYAGGVYNSWYQHKVWVPGYTIVRGDHAQWVPGGWEYRE